MTVDQSKSSPPNSELQDYVESLLFDQPDDTSSESSISNVAQLNRISVKNSPLTSSKFPNESTLRKADKRNMIELTVAKNLRKIDNNNKIEQLAENSTLNSQLEKSNHSTTRMNKDHQPVSNDINEVSKFKLIDSLEIASSKIKKETDTQNTYTQHLDQFDRAAIDPRLKNVEKLLSKISLVQLDEHPNNARSSQTDQADELSEQAIIEKNLSTFDLRKSRPLKEVLGDEFQTLVFDVNRLPLAVPLVKLGGILNINEQDITPLVGTPDWFMGLVRHEERNLLVVDTQQFLMPEKATADDREYSFLILLDDSNWALACHAVGDAKNLTPDQVRWSTRNSKRPWFAGMVLEYMSALLEVDNLINLLAENIAE